MLSPDANKLGIDVEYIMAPKYSVYIGTYIRLSEFQGSYF
jgi:hypothetical protein